MRNELIATILMLCTIIKSIASGPFPQSPCPMNFHYAFVGGDCFGIAKIYPQIYNRFHTSKITIQLSLSLNRYIPNATKMRLLHLYKPLNETYKDIADRHPIVYRVDFLNDNGYPILLKMQVNGKQICSNHMPNIDIQMSKIELQHTIYLPTTDDPDPVEKHYAHNSVRNSAVTKDSLSLTRSRIILSGDDEIESYSKPELVIQRKKVSNIKCGTFDDEFKYTTLVSTRDGVEKILQGTWPWLVAIWHNTIRAAKLNFKCTANLITNRVVLTTARCFQADSKLKSIPAKDILLAFGRYNIDDWTETNVINSNVLEIIFHPDYLHEKPSNVFDADIAILITKKTIHYSATIRPICLWPSNIDGSSIIGKNGTLIGWGQSFESFESKTPRRLNLPVVRNHNCFPKDKIIRKRRIFCAGSERRGNAPCNGDSGSGFAIWRNGVWFLRGLVSAAVGDPILNRCELNTFTIFTDIAHYKNWIENNIYKIDN